MTRSRHRGAGRSRLLALGPVVAALAGCSVGGPYAPGPSVVPSAPAVTGAPAVRPADLDLSGDVTTADGLTFHVVHQVWFGDVTTSLPDRGRRRVGWTRVQRAATGETTVSNGADRANPTAGATVYTFYAGYPAGSEVCRLAARQGDAEVTGDRCWLRLGVTVPYSYGRGERPAELAAGDSRRGGFDAVPPDTVDVPVAQFGAVSEALRRPSDLVVLASGIGGVAHPAYRHACRAAGADASQAFVVVGGSSPLGCRDVPGA